MDTVLASDFGVALQQRAPDCLASLTASACMALFLLWEQLKGAQSAWHHYLAMLPASYNTPLHFTESELALLPASLRARVDQRIGEVDAVFEQAVAALRPVVRMESGEAWQAMACTTRDAFLWAYSSVQTRCVHFEAAARDHGGNGKDCEGWMVTSRRRDVPRVGERDGQRRRASISGICAGAAAGLAQPLACGPRHGSIQRHVRASCCQMPAHLAQGQAV